MPDDTSPVNPGRGRDRAHAEYLAAHAEQVASVCNELINGGLISHETHDLFNATHWIVSTVLDGLKLWPASS